MKTNLFKTAFLLLFAACFACEKEYPMDISFQEYSLAETSCQWINLDYNENLIVINSDEELKNYIACTDSSYSEIDFSKYTLLLVSGTTPNGIDNIKKNLQQLSANVYKLDINIALNGTEVIGRWCVALITHKLNEKNTVSLNVSTNQDPTTVCGVNDPLTDLPWLKEIVNGFERDELSHTRITQCTYKDGVGFLIESCVGCPDFGSILTNCNGETLCILFGFAGDPCTEFEIDFDSIKVIWEKNN